MGWIYLAFTYIHSTAEIFDCVFRTKVWTSTNEYLSIWAVSMHGILIHIGCLQHLNMSLQEGMTWALLITGYSCTNRLSCQLLSIKISPSQMKSRSCTIWVQLKKSGMQGPTEWVKIFLTFYPKSNWDDAISMSCFERAFQLVQLKSET